MRWMGCTLLQIFINWLKEVPSIVLRNQVSFSQIFFLDHVMTALNFISRQTAPSNSVWIRRDGMLMLKAFARPKIVIILIKQNGFMQIIASARCPHNRHAKEIFTIFFFFFWFVRPAFSLRSPFFFSFSVFVSTGLHFSNV